MKRYWMSLGCLIAAFAANAAAQQVIPLYDGPAPGTEKWTHEEKEYYSPLFRTEVVTNVTKPTITAFLPDPAKATGTAVVIAPGGGFHALSINSEGNDVAKWLAERGVAGFVLRYRLVPTGEDGVKEMMAKASDLGKAIKDMAEVAPFAGADGLAATDDQLDLAKDSVSIYSKWLAAKKPAEMHLYAKGGHGFGMRKQDLPTDQWIERFGEWLELQGLMKQAS